MSDLKPCPFCGSTELRVEGDDELDWVVSCDTCRAMGGDGYTKAEAIERWNTREGEDRLRDLMAEDAKETERLLKELQAEHALAMQLDMSFQQAQEELERVEKDLRAEQALSASLGRDLTQAEEENKRLWEESNKLRALVLDMFRDGLNDDTPFAVEDEFYRRIRDLGIEVE